MSAKQSESIGIKLENCSGGTVRGNVSVGHDVGIDAKDSHGIEYVDNVSVAPEVAAVFLGLIAAIEGSSLDPSAKQKLVQCAHAMRDSSKTPGFIEKYKNFMAVLADHMQVLGPVVAPFLPALSALL